MRISILKFMVIGFILITIGCENDSESDLIDVTPVNIVTYTNNVKDIIDNNCILCHNDPPINFAPMSLLSIEQVKEALENRNLIGRISSENVSFSMPFGEPRLPQSTIDMIIQWRDDGLLE